MKKNKMKYIMLLELSFLIYSISSLFSKMASQNVAIFPKMVVFYIASVALLGIYAIIWQQVLKKIKLSIAYANKGIVIMWGMLWGVVIFGETIKINMVIGAGIIMAGIYILARENKDE